MSEGKRPLERPMCRFGDNIKMNPEENTRLWTGFIRLKRDVNGRLL